MLRLVCGLQSITQHCRNKMQLLPVLYLLCVETMHVGSSKSRICRQGGGSPACGRIRAHTPSALRYRNLCHPPTGSRSRCG